MTVKDIEEKFLQWMASTRTGSMFKIAIGTSLAYVAEVVTDWDVPVIVSLVIIALIPVIINEINPKDPRYGRTKSDEEVIDNG